MAVYNEILAGRFNRALQKLTSIKGSPPVRTLGSEILPVFPMFWGVENRYLESWDRFGAYVNQPAVAANFSQVRMRNPAGSNIVAVFEKITWFDANLSPEIDILAMQVGPDLGQLATGVALTANRFDNRGRPQPTLLMSRTAAAQPSAIQLAVTVAGPAGVYDIIVYENQEIPLLPGDCLTIGNSGTNTSLNVNFWWRERFLEDSERF